MFQDQSQKLQNERVKFAIYFSYFFKDPFKVIEKGRQKIKTCWKIDHLFDNGIRTLTVIHVNDENSVWKIS